MAPSTPGSPAPGAGASAPQLSIPRMDIDHLSVAYDGKLAVKEVSLPVRQGEVLSLIGPSGCGKTTLLRSLNRLTELTRSASLSGRVTLDGVDISRMEPTALRRRVTMVFQQPNPFPMSVFDNLAYVLREQGSRRGSRRSLNDPVCEALERAGLLEEVKDESRSRRRSSTASNSARHRASAGGQAGGAPAR